MCGNARGTSESLLRDSISPLGPNPEVRAHIGKRINSACSSSRTSTKTFPLDKVLSPYPTFIMSSAADRMAQLEQLIAERRRLEEERTRREAEQLPELVEMVRVEEEKRRAEEQRRREEEEKRQAEERRVAQEKDIRKF